MNSLKADIPKIVWILGVSSLLTDSSSEMIHSILPLFLVSTLKADTLIVGLIDGSGEAIASIVKLGSGALSDYFQKRRTLIIAGYGLSSVVKILFAIAPDPLMVLIARSLDRTGKGIRGAPRDALIADVTPELLRGQAYGLRQSLDSIGAFIGPFIAFGLLFLIHVDYRTVFWVALIPGVLAVILLLLAVEEPAKRDKSQSIRENPLTRQSIGKLGRGFWSIFATILVFSLGNSSDAFLLLKLRQVGVTETLIPLGLVLMNITYAFSAYPAGKLSDAVGRKSLLTVAFLLYSCLYTGLALTSDALQVWVLLALYGCYLGLSQAVLLAVVADAVPAELRGTAFGLLNLSVGVAVLPASLIAGWLWEKTSSSNAFFAGALFAAIAAILLMFAGKGSKEQTRINSN